MAAGALALALLAGCATPEARIKRDRAAFDALPTEQQALVREGKVGLGFTPEAVRLAVGDPDQKWIRTDAKGRTDIWAYTRYQTVGGAPVFTGYYHRYYDGYRYHGGAGLVPERTQAKEYFRVEFIDGKVSLVQEEDR